MIDYIREGRSAHVADSWSAASFRSRYLPSGLLFASRHHSRGRISPGTFGSYSTTQFRVRLCTNQPARRDPSRASFTPRSSTTTRPARNCARSCRRRASSKCRSSSVFSAFSRRSLISPAAGLARHGCGNDRSIWRYRLQRRLRHAQRTFERHLQGIWLTTAAGLVVATPTFVAYSYLSARVNTMMHEMERAGIGIVHMLTDHAPESGIISFDPAAKITERGAGLDR